MSKAEDLSKQYRDYREQCGIKDPVMLDEIEEACYEGYYQAEKDLELNWEDIKLLDKIFMYERVKSGLILGKEEYEKILKRYKDLKK